MPGSTSFNWYFMLEFLNQIDTKIFLFLNGIHNPFWDSIMWHISGTYIWIPLYLFVLFLIFKKIKWQGILTLVMLVVLVLISDQGSVMLFKNVFLRLRPCHQPELVGLVHIVNGKCGGQYGFVSSHAANTFAFAMFAFLLFRSSRYRHLLFVWAFIVSYSRIYLGVHYPFDLLGGAIWGLLCAVSIFILHQKIIEAMFKKKARYRAFEE